MLDALGGDLRDATNLRKCARNGVTATRRVDARSGDRFDGTTRKEVLAGCTAVERTGLITNTLREIKRAYDSARLGQAVCEIPFGFRPPATAVVLPSESAQLAAFLPRERVPVAVGLRTDFGRQAAIVAGRRQRRTGSLGICLVIFEGSPFWAVVDLFRDSVCLLVDRCEILLRKGFPWISDISVVSPPKPPMLSRGRWGSSSHCRAVVVTCVRTLSGIAIQRGDRRVVVEPFS